VRLEDAILFGCGEAGIERDDLWRAAGKIAATELVGGFEDVAFGGEEDEDIAAAEGADFFDRVGDAAERVDFFGTVFAAQGAIGTSTG
jgi:hypothetical protein